MIPATTTNGMFRLLQSLDMIYVTFFIVISSTYLGSFHKENTVNYMPWLIIVSVENLFDIQTDRRCAILMNLLLHFIL